MAEKIRILHVDDDLEWVGWVEELLTAEGYEVSSFTTLAGAKTAFVETDFDVIICDGRIHYGADGHAWASELVTAGCENVIVLSRLNPGLRVPFVGKNDWVDGGKEKLLSLVKELVGGTNP